VSKRTRDDHKRRGIDAVASWLLGVGVDPAKITITVLDIAEYSRRISSEEVVYQNTNVVRRKTVTSHHPAHVTLSWDIGNHKFEAVFYPPPIDEITVSLITISAKGDKIVLTDVERIKNILAP
jgi:hypothetical protein